MADLQLSIRVVAQDGSVRTVEITSGGALDVQPGDRLILFGADAAKARLVRQGDDLALVIDDQVVFTLGDYYTLEGPQAAEVITDPAVAATFLTAGEGGVPLLTAPVLETGAGAGPPGAQAPPVDLVQATSPELPGDNASARGWDSDEDILLDDPTYRPIVITYDDEAEFIITEGPTPPPGPVPPEPVNLPPYFTTVVFDGEGNPSPGEKVEEYNFQMYEYVGAYQWLPNTEAHPPHYWEWTGDEPAGTTFWMDFSFDGGGLPTDLPVILPGFGLPFIPFLPGPGFGPGPFPGNGDIGPRPEFEFMFAQGWGYLPNDALGWVGVADPENDPLTVEWVGQTLSGHASWWWGGEWDFQLSEVLWDAAFGGHDAFGSYILPDGSPLYGDGVLELYVDTNADPAWENVFQVWSSLIVGGGYQYPAYYEYDGPDGVAANLGVTDHFQTFLSVQDPYHAPVTVPVNFDILDVNEAPEFDSCFYFFNPWEENGNGVDFPTDIITVAALVDEVIVLNDFPDYDVPEGYGLFVGNVHAVDPDFLDQAEFGGQVLYSFMHNIDEQGGDPDWIPYLEWVGDAGDTAGWRAELLDQFSEDGVLWINETTGDIWADESYWDLIPYSLTWDDGNMPPDSCSWEQCPTNHTYSGPQWWTFSDGDSDVLVSAWTEGDDSYTSMWPTGYYNGFYGEWTPGDGWERGDLAYTEYNGKSGLAVEGKGPESSVDELDDNEWLVLNFERPVLLIDMDLQLFYDNTGKCHPFKEFEWGKYAITSASTGDTFEVYFESDAGNGDYHYDFEHTGYVTSIAFQAGDWGIQTGDWANDYLLNAISYEQMPDPLDPALVYAHDGVDRYGEVYDGGGTGDMVYDHDRIYSDLWDAAMVMVADPPIPEDHPILNDQRHWTEESMQTAAPIKEWIKCEPEYNIYDGTLAEPVYWLGDLIDLDNDVVTYQIIGGNTGDQWMVVYGDGHYENGIWVDDDGDGSVINAGDTKAYIVANDATTLDYEDTHYYGLTVETYEDGTAYDTGLIEIYLTNVNESPWLDHFHEYHHGTQDIYDNPVEPWNFATLEGGEPQPLFEHRDAVVETKEVNAKWTGYLGDFDADDPDFDPPPPSDHLHFFLTGSENHDPADGMTGADHPDDHFWGLTDAQANYYFDIGKHSGHLRMEFDFKEWEWNVDELIRGTYEFRVMVHDKGTDGPEYYDSALVQFEVANHLPDIPCKGDFYESMQTPTNYLDNDDVFFTDASIMSNGLVYLGQDTDFDGDTVTYATTTGGWHTYVDITTDSWYLAYNTPSALDYEVTDHYHVDVSVTDGIDTAYKNVKVNVLNVNETPTLTGESNPTIDVSAAIGTMLADYDATDPDTGEVLTYELLSLTPGSTFNPNDYFAIDSNGEITVIADIGDLDPGQYSFRVAVEDDGGVRADGTSNISGPHNLPPFPADPTDLDITGPNNWDDYLADQMVVELDLTDNIHGVQFNGRGQYEDVGVQPDMQGLAIGGPPAEQEHDTDGVHAGWSVSNLGDINGDGFDDFIIGAPYADGVYYEWVESEEVTTFDSFGLAGEADSFFIADFMHNQDGDDIAVTIDAKIWVDPHGPNPPPGHWEDTNVTSGWHYESGTEFGLGVKPTNQFYIDSQKDETLTMEFSEDVTISGVELIDLWNNNEDARVDFFDDGTLTHYLTVNIAGSGGGSRTATVTVTEISSGISSSHTESVADSGPHIYDVGFEITTDFLEFTSVGSGDKYAVGGLRGGYTEGEEYVNWDNGEAYVIFGDGTWDPTDPTTLPYGLSRPVHLDSDPDLGGMTPTSPNVAGFVIHGETGDGHYDDMAGFSVANAGDVGGGGLAGQDGHLDILIGAPGVDRVSVEEIVHQDTKLADDVKITEVDDVYFTGTAPGTWAFGGDQADNFAVEVSGSYVHTEGSWNPYYDYTAWEAVYPWLPHDTSGAQLEVYGDWDTKLSAYSAQWDPNGNWDRADDQFVPDNYIPGRHISGWYHYTGAAGQDINDETTWLVVGADTGGSNWVGDLGSGQGYLSQYWAGYDAETGEVLGDALTWDADGWDGGAYWAMVNHDEDSTWTEYQETVVQDVGAAYVVFGHDGVWDADVYLDEVVASDGALGIKIIGDEVGESSGWSVHTAFDFNGDGYDDLLVGSPFNSGATAPDRGEAHIIWGMEDWTTVDGLVDLDNLGDGGFRIHNKGPDNDYEEAGWSVGFLGDLNGDGGTEVVIGVPGDHTVGGGDAPGVTYVLVSDADYYENNESAGLWNLWTNDKAIRIVGENDGDLAGYSVSSAGDIDGDGLDDLIIGAPGHDFQEPDVFHEDSYEFSDYTPGYPGSKDLRFDNYIHSIDGATMVGVTVDGDEYRFGNWNDKQVTYNGGELGVDGKGPDDQIDGNRDEYMTFTFDSNVILTGFMLGDNSSSDDGYAKLYDDSWNLLDTIDINNGVDEYSFGETEVRYVEFWTDGGYSDDYSVAGFKGGYNEEGDLIENTGAAYVVFGSTIEGVIGDDNPTIQLADLDGTNGFKIVGDDEGDELGTSVSAAGDVNGDGVDDIIVGSPGDDNDTGEAVIIFGDDDGSTAWDDGIIVVSDILDDPETGVIIEGADEGDRFGESVSGAGDVNADGEDDVIIGAPEADGDAQGGEGGEAYLVFGAPEMTAADVVEIEELVAA